MSTKNAPAPTPAPEKSKSGRVTKIEPPVAPAWAGEKAAKSIPPKRVELSGKTACWIHEGWYFTAGYKPIAPAPASAS